MFTPRLAACAARVSKGVSLVRATRCILSQGVRRCFASTVRLRFVSRPVACCDVQRLILGCPNTVPDQATQDVGLTRDQVEFFHENGYLVIEDFWTRETCDNLIKRANEIVEEFDPSTVSVFSTNEQVRGRVYRG